MLSLSGFAFMQVPSLWVSSSQNAEFEFAEFYSFKTSYWSGLKELKNSILKENLLISGQYLQVSHDSCLPATIDHYACYSALL